jgi:hypothetical protein
MKLPISKAGMQQNGSPQITEFHLLLSLVLGQNPSALAEIATNLFVGLAFLANSRSDEDQAIVCPLNISRRQKLSRRRKILLREDEE